MYYFVEFAPSFSSRRQFFGGAGGEGPVSCKTSKMTKNDNSSENFKKNKINQKCFKMFAEHFGDF